MGDASANDYPNAENYPKPSFPRSVVPPSVDPDEGDLVCIELAPEWLPVLMGAVDQLLLPSTWDANEFNQRLAVQRADTLKNQIADAKPMLQIRYNALTCLLEQSLDGGDTWETVPGYELAIACEIGPVEMGIVGDDLELSHGATVLSEVPKSALQSFLDRWIDNNPASAVERFTGRFINRAHASNPNLQEWEDSGGALYAKSTIQDNMLTYQSASVGKGFRLAAAGANVTAHDNGVRLGSNHNAPSSDPKYGRVSVDVANDIIMSLRAIGGAGYDFARFFDDADALRASLIASGHWRGAGFEGWDYTSTSWQRSMSIVPVWTESTDAVRQGGLAARIHSYTGDHTAIEAFYPPGDPDQTMLRFHGPGPTGSARQIYRPGPGYEVSALAGIMASYGLIELEEAIVLPEEAPTLTAWELCNATYYVAQQVSDTITTIFDMLETGTDLESLQNALKASPFEFAAWVVTTVVTKAQAAYANAAGIAADLADVQEIADALLDAGFDLENAIINLDAGPFLSQTVELVEDVLEVVYQDNVNDWIAVGKYVPAPACSASTLPCEDRTYDFRWSDNQGWDIDDGTIEFNVGIKNAFNDPYWRVFLEGNFDACRVKRVKVGYFCDNTAQQIHVLPYESDGMGGYDLLGSGHFGTPTAGHNEMVVTFPGSGHTLDLLRVRLESELVEYNNYIKYVRIELE